MKPIGMIDGRGAAQQQTGLTKREYFAGLAMQGILASYADVSNICDADANAKEAVLRADALIAALNKEATE